MERFMKLWHKQFLDRPIDEFFALTTYIYQAKANNPVIQLKVDAFNALPSPEFIRRDTPNNWSFHVQFPCKGSLPPQLTGLVWCRTLSSDRERTPQYGTFIVDVEDLQHPSDQEWQKLVTKVTFEIISLFLKEGIHIAPRSWSIPHQILSHSISIAMRALGIREELQIMKYCSEDEQNTLLRILSHVRSTENYRDRRAPAATAAFEKKADNEPSSVGGISESRSTTIVDDAIQPETKSKKNKKRKNRKKKKKKASANKDATHLPDVESTVDVHPENSDSDDEPSTKSQEVDDPEAGTDIQIPTDSIGKLSEGLEMATDIDGNDNKEKSPASGFSNPPNSVQALMKSAQPDVEDLTKIRKKPNVNKPRDWRRFIAVGEIGLNTLEDEHGITPFDIVHPQHRPLSSS